MTSKKTYVEPFIEEADIIQQTHLLQNISVKEWNKGNDHNWGGDEADEENMPNILNERELPNDRNKPFRMLWNEY